MELREHKEWVISQLRALSKQEGWKFGWKATPDFFIEEVCQDAAPYGLAAQEVTAAIAFLKNRRDNLREIINNHREEFSAIQAWSLSI